MNKSIPRISILMITYKQETLVKRAIESLLQQKEYIYEICVSDDYSPDATWEVLQEYKSKYPTLFKLHRNKVNLGIFQNIETVWTMPSGDLVYLLAGDDSCYTGWFKHVVDLIKTNQIDYINEKICIYGNYKCVYPSGDYFIVRNNLAQEGYDLVSLTLRGLICNRSACYSRNILDLFFNVSKGRSYVAEWAQEIQLPYFIDKAYYINSIGNVYYTRIGVNTHFNKSILKEREWCFLYMKSCLESKGYRFSQKDKYYIEFLGLRYNSYRDKTLNHFIKKIKYNILCRTTQYGFWRTRKRIFKRYVFALLRRFPHSKLLKWTIN